MIYLLSAYHVADMAISYVSTNHSLQVFHTIDGISNVHLINEIIQAQADWQFLRSHGC